MTDMIKNDIFGVCHTTLAGQLGRWLKFGSGGLGERLSLYHNVLSTFVTPGDTQFPDLEVKPARLDLLLCEGDEALLAIFEGSASENQLSTCKALGLACVPHSTICDGDDELFYEYLETYLEQMQEERRRGGTPPRYAARILRRVVEDAEGREHVDEEQWVYQRQKETRMLVQAEDGRQPWWYFTWYGAEMGLAEGLLPGRDMATSVCAEAAWDKIWEVFDGCCQEPEAEAKQLPLETRLKRAARGEKAPQFMSRIVGDFGTAPLGQWMADYPDELKQLVDAGLTPESTYCEAAAHIYKMLQDEKQEKQGRQLLLALNRTYVKGGNEPF